MAERQDDEDRPIPREDPFHQELRMFLAPRVNPASNPGPPGNPPADPLAVARAALMLRLLVG